MVERIDAKIDEALLEKEVEPSNEVNIIFVDQKEGISKEEQESEEQKEEQTQTPSKIAFKFVQKHHLEDQIIGDVDTGVQTRRRMKNTPKGSDITLRSLIEPKDFTQERIHIG